MNYELALALKNAGFPQITEPKPGQGYWYSENGQEGLFVPSLLELIEACKPYILLFEDVDDGWIAYCKRDGFLFEIGISVIELLLNTEFAKGSTPSEAVANLWLKLNEKPSL